MQLDKTRIAVRERGVLDTLDLSLHVARVYALPLMVTMAMGVIPLMVINHLLLDWMLLAADNELDYPFRFVYNMTLLVFIEAPLASIFASSYLGQVVFLDRPRLRDVVVDVGKMFPRIVWCQLLVRGIAPAWLVLFSLDRYGEFNGWLEGFVLVALALGAGIFRALRPFINEIVLLERNPLSSKNKRVMTVGRRSSMLHGASGGDLFLRAIVAGLIGVLLVLSLYGTFMFPWGVMRNNWSQPMLMIRFGLPLAMWITTGYFTVFRFLSYLDVRIRQEGWEVELRLRAEAARLAQDLSQYPSKG
ncbi:MAG: hypothetical protein H8E44_23795 [Planctomycetes bacterium]|nr:hypothetical protein [Planctomycetota bacterium]MBL7043781.1 hypothetical protein [Pirellulaceae bacterium]